MPWGTSIRRYLMPNSRVLATVNANGFATTQVYDAIGELLAVIDARGNRNSFSL